MRKKLAALTGIVTVLTVMSFGPATPAAACDPENNYPCDPTPQEVPHWCKLSPTC